MDEEVKMNDMEYRSSIESLWKIVLYAFMKAVENFHSRMNFENKYKPFVKKFLM